MIGHLFTSDMVWFHSLTLTGVNGNTSICGMKKLWEGIGLQIKTGMIETIKKLSMMRFFFPNTSSHKLYNSKQKNK